MVGSAQKLNRTPQIFAVGTEIRIGERPLASPKTSEIVSQNPPTPLGQPSRYSNNCLEIFVAGKAVAEDHPRAYFLRGHFQNAGQDVSTMTWKANSMAMTQQDAPRRCRCFR
jgi:hypothetical protein